MNNVIKFRKHYIQKGNIKVKVWYSIGKLINDNRDCVTITEKLGIGNNLRNIFPELYSNNSDMREDYFERDRVRIFVDNPLYEEVLKQAIR